MAADDGFLTIAWALLTLVLMVVGAMLLPLGVAVMLRAEAVSAADAAALAAAEALNAELLEVFAATGDSDPGALDDDAARAAAWEYARRNGARLVNFTRRDLEVTVTVRADVDLGGRGSEVAENFSRQTTAASARAGLVPLPAPDTTVPPGTVPAPDPAPPRYDVRLLPL